MKNMNLEEVYKLSSENEKEMYVNKKNYVYGKAIELSKEDIRNLANGIGIEIDHKSQDGKEYTKLYQLKFDGNKAELEQIPDLTLFKSENTQIYVLTKDDKTIKINKNQKFFDQDIELNSRDVLRLSEDKSIYKSVLNSHGHKYQKEFKGKLNEEFINIEGVTKEKNNEKVVEEVENIIDDYMKDKEKESVTKSEWSKDSSSDELER